jgi:sporulation protein YlmC with PRC-barrel domain
MKQTLLSVAIAVVLAGSAAYAQSNNSGQTHAQPAKPASGQSEMHQLSTTTTTKADGTKIVTTNSTAKTGTTQMAANANSTMATAQTEFRASDLIGLNVKNADGNTIGEIKDLVIQNNKEVQRAVLSVGGFLGMGDKLVAVPYNELKVSRSDGKDYVTYPATKDELKAMPKFSYDLSATTNPTSFRVHDLIDQKVKNASGDTIGEIDNLIITASDKVPQAIISVGGFLGIGDKLVAVPFDQLKIDRVGDKDQVHYDSTKESLKAMPSFNYRARS